MYKLAFASIILVIALTLLISCGEDEDGLDNGDNCLSLDNTKIAFVTDRDGNAEIYVMNADGTDQINLTNNPAHDSSPSWSPDGTKIAFMTGRDINGEIYVMNADGTDQVNLTNNPADDICPSWSPFLTAESAHLEVPYYPAYCLLLYAVVKEQRTYNLLRKDQLNAVSQDAPLI
jgi:dipeptidyl aminopeptidase/acylaminoacyl peptidase